MVVFGVVDSFRNSGEKEERGGKGVFRFSLGTNDRNGFL
jgi:hypothetical protein